MTLTFVPCLIWERFPVRCWVSFYLWRTDDGESRSQGCESGFGSKMTLFRLHADPRTDKQTEGDTRGRGAQHAARSSVIINNRTWNSSLPLRHVHLGCCERVVAENSLFHSRTPRPESLCCGRQRNNTEPLRLTPVCLVGLVSAFQKKRASAHISFSVFLLQKKTTSQILQLTK